MAKPPWAEELAPHLGFPYTFQTHDPIAADPAPPMSMSLEFDPDVQQNVRDCEAILNDARHAEDLRKKQLEEAKALLRIEMGLRARCVTSRVYEAIASSTDLVECTFWAVDLCLAEVNSRREQFSPASSVRVSKGPVKLIEDRMSPRDLSGHPLQAVADAHGLWFSHTRRTAPEVPLHLQPKHRVRTAQLWHNRRRRGAASRIPQRRPFLPLSEECSAFSEMSASYSRFLLTLGREDREAIAQLAPEIIICATIRALRDKQISERDSSADTDAIEFILSTKAEEAKLLKRKAEERQASMNEVLTAVRNDLEFFFRGIDDHGKVCPPKPNFESIGTSNVGAASRRPPALFSWQRDIPTKEAVLQQKTTKSRAPTRSQSYAPANESIRRELQDALKVHRNTNRPSSTRDLISQKPSHTDDIIFFPAPPPRIHVSNYTPKTSRELPRQTPGDDVLGVPTTSRGQIKIPSSPKVQCFKRLQQQTMPLREKLWYEAGRRVDPRVSSRNMFRGAFNLRGLSRCVASEINNVQHDAAAATRHARMEHLEKLDAYVQAVKEGQMIPCPPVQQEQGHPTTPKLSRRHPPQASHIIQWMY